MNRRETDSVSIIIDELLNEREIYIEKTDILISFINDIISCFLKEKDNPLISPNYHLFYRETRILKREFSFPKCFMMIKGESLPLLLTIFIRIFSSEKIPISKAALETIISEIQKTVFMENEEFLSLKPFLKLSMLYLAANSEEENEIGIAIEGISAVDAINLEELINDFSASERLFLKEKSGIYSKMDEKSKSFYRYRLSLLSKKEGKTELKEAEEIIEKSGRHHIGNALFKSAQFEDKRKKLKKTYMLLLFLVPFIIAFVVSLLGNSIAAGLFSYIAFYPASKTLLDRIFLRFSTPFYLPGLKIGDKISENEATVVVISILLDSSLNTEKLKKHLLDEYTKAPRGELYFNILCDLKESSRKTEEGDEAVIEKAAAVIRELNLEYENKFSLIVRKRSYSDTMKCYIGKNRKRGAVGEICAYICGDNVKFYKTEGDVSALLKCKYMILLDSDTKMTIGTARRLISAAAHPLNKPIFENGKVVSGYGIISPRAIPNPEGLRRNFFTLILNGERGLSHYNDNIRDINSELFLKSIFCGKGIINIEAFHKVTANFFKDEEVLSHDILEGIILRCATASDAVVLEGFPKNYQSFLKRNDRWIRGDFQNILFLFDVIKNRFYEKIKNPFSASDKLKILENCIRALSPVFILLLICTSALSYGKGARFIFAVSLVGVLFSPIYYFISILFRIIKTNKESHSGLIREVIRELLYAIVKLSLLPIEALNALSAAATGLYRILFSKKDMLLWTPAAAADKQAVSFIKLSAPSLFFGALFLLSFKGYIRFIGIVFLLTPVILCLFKKTPPSGKIKIGSEERYNLKKEAELIWNFFKDYVTKEENYLPPDNVSFSPKFEIAHRTSPTNIGLYLLSIYGAYNLELISASEMLFKINNTLDTIEALEKYDGHLYNWYNTKTLEIMAPRYISTVDNGNFIASLTALKELIEDKNTKSRLEKIIDSTDFKPLYDKNKKLFVIGIDASTGEKSRHHYDMLFSESRITGYMAVARGEADKEHISALQRLFSKADSFSGPVSWTGTAFEYFMPAIFMPTYKNTIYDLALRYAVFCQKGKAKKASSPIGTSESGYYEFDDNMNYQYKAHGAGKLAIKRGMEKDNVISPYSTFLMMQTAFSDMYKNYKVLKNNGFSGEYGLYEAIDYTVSRVGATPKVVKSYMSHHMGMSFLSIVNILSDFSIQKGFMKDRKMNSARELLLEEIPFSNILYETNEKREPPERIPRFKTEEYTSFNPETPRVSALSSGELTFTSSDSGAAELNFKKISLIRPPKNLFSPAGGFFAAVNTGETAPITAFPIYNEENRKTVFGGRFISHYLSKKNFDSGICYRLLSNTPALEITLAFKNNLRRKISGYFEFFFEPILTEKKHFYSHPAYNKLFVSAEKLEDGAIFWREKGEKLYLAVKSEGELSLNREEILENGLLNLSKSDKTYLPDTACYLRIPFSASSGERIDKKIIISVGVEKEKALENAKAAESGENYCESFLQVDSPIGILAFSLLGKLLYGGRDSHSLMLFRKYNDGDKDELYKASLSGDNPIVFLEFGGEKEKNRLKTYLEVWKGFRLYNIAFDLCIAISDSGYRKPSEEAVKELISELGIKDSLGKNGGIHIINLSEIGEKTVNTIRAAAVHLSEKNSPELGIPLFPFKRFEILSAKKGNPPYNIEAADRCGGFIKGGYMINKNPPLPWSAPYTNSVGGTLLTNDSLGYTFFGNAKENMITPFLGDTKTPEKGELLLIKVGDKYFDPLLGSAAVFLRTKAEYYSVIENLEIKVTVSFDGVKKVSVDIKNNSEEKQTVAVGYMCDIILSDGTGSHMTNLKKEENAIVAYNPFSSYKYRAALKCDRKAIRVTDKEDFFIGRWEETRLAAAAFPIAALVCELEIEKREESVNFFLSAAATEKAALSNLSRPSDMIDKIEIETKDKAFSELYNTFLPWQIKRGRIEGRTGYYQCGGAYGFRDQLQDIIALAAIDRKTAKTQILRSAAVQFVEGDVLHWWHKYPREIRGIRSKCSDDLLWLPFAAAEYALISGDYNIFRINVPYIEGEALNEGENEKYITPKRSSLKAPLYNHCLKAIEKARSLGERGLLKMGLCDWNDGMNKIGDEGRGESVWLSMFYLLVLESFSVVSAKFSDKKTEAILKKEASRIKDVIEKTSFYSGQYLRAFTDEGAPIGHPDNKECKIDILPQSFAAIAGLNKERVESALKTAEENLVIKDKRLVLLFSPPFKETSPSPGYIADYPKGIRENGGQYTHSAVWFALALYKAGKSEKAEEILKMISPLSRPDIYKTEPYFLAADVYSNPDLIGRGGWSIYTGSASWYYKVVTEEMLGILKRGNKLYINPKIDYSAEIIMENTKIKLQAEAGKKDSLLVNEKAAEYILLDGKEKNVKKTFSI
ncbi:MAG: DUF3131 domain-containing protein [Oscillospiraceae bacterium]|nr:DUF3131 domain-containing protein [Oscillospiraceae bacterium]